MCVTGFGIRLKLHKQHPAPLGSTEHKTSVCAAADCEPPGLTPQQDQPGPLGQPSPLFSQSELGQGSKPTSLRRKARNTHNLESRAAPPRLRYPGTRHRQGQGTLLHTSCHRY